MNPREPSTSFEAARRQHLIDATIEALADVGFKAASLSQIARRADVSTGLFAHYFGDKDGLLEATLRFMAARLVRATRTRLRNATCARERLYAVPDSALADQEFERRTSAVWLAFWGQITHSARYQRIQYIYQRRMLSNLRHDLRELVPPPCVEPYATMIAAMIDGVWIRSHASPTQTDGAHARAIVRQLIDGLILGVVDTPRRRAKPAQADVVIRIPAPATREHTMVVVSPVTQEDLGTIHVARRPQVEEAVERARWGLDEWRRMTGSARERTLRLCARSLWEEAGDLARLDALCTGRPVADTLAFGLPRAARAFERFATLAARPTVTRVDLGAGAFGDKRLEPLGIVAAFGHWSSPLMNAGLHAAAALAMGNAMVFQPAYQAPLTAMRLADMFERVGLPAGAFTVLNGDADTTRLLRAHADLKAQDPMTAHFEKRRSATIVFAGADMDRAVTAILHGGQRWKSTPDYSENPIFVQRGGLDAFRARLLERAAKMRCGDPRDPKTQIGILMSESHFRTILNALGQALDGGASLLAGGYPDDAVGHSLAPTILEGCRIDTPVVRRELFAPVIPLIAFESDEEVVGLLRAESPSAAIGLFDSDPSHANRIADSLAAPLCCINDGAAGAIDDGFDLWAEIEDVAPGYVSSARVFLAGPDRSVA
jgi:betaine-aldehyde dehydrogenase